MNNTVFFLIHVGILVLLICVNAFFSAAEVALISLKKATIRRLSKQGKRGQTVAVLTKDSARYLAAVQLGVTLAGFTASAFASDTFSDPLTEFLRNHGIIWGSAKTMDATLVVAITIVLSFLTLVFGELAPKQIALRHSEAIALFSAGIINWFAGLCAPAISFLNFAVKWVIKPFGIRDEDNDSVTEEEIRTMIDLGVENGTVLSEEQQLINKVFDFNDHAAAEIMTRREDVVALDIDSPPELVEETLLEHFGGHIPIYRGEINHVIGDLQFHRYFRAKHRNGGKSIPLQKIISPVCFAPENIATHELLRQMRRGKYSFAVLQGKNGVLTGVVTMKTLLSQIVGPLDDETIIVKTFAGKPVVQ